MAWHSGRTAHPRSATPSDAEPAGHLLTCYQTWGLVREYLSVLSPLLQGLMLPY